MSQVENEGNETLPSEQELEFIDDKADEGEKSDEMVVSKTDEQPEAEGDTTESRPEPHILSQNTDEPENRTSETNEIQPAKKRRKIVEIDD